MIKIKIEVSARHLHISRKDLDKLFGKGYELKPVKDLSQKKQYASEEMVTLKTEAGELNNLRILGPVRKETQIELSMTDARKLKLKPPIRLSGEIKGSLGASLVGPKGEVKLKEGVIIAQRHIHCDPETAKKLKLSEKRDVSVKTFGDRGLVFNKVPVRIDESFVFRMHIDTDEGNASLPEGVCAEGELII